MELNGTNFRTISIKKLIKADWNYKEDDIVLQSKLVENIKQNGQLENIIVRKLKKGFFEIVNGNHRYDAFKECNINNIVVCDVGEVSLEKAKLIALATNETKFKLNDSKLFELLKNISSEIPIMDMSKVLPWDESLITDKINSLNFSFETLPAATQDQLNEVDNRERSNNSSDQNSDDKANLYVRMEDHVLKNWHELINKIKKDLFPDNDLDEIDSQLAYQFIIQHFSEIDMDMN